MKPFTLGQATVEPGGFAETKVGVSEFYTHTRVDLPVFIRHGKRPGPVLLVAAAIHGDEINGVQVVHDMALALRDKDISGTFVGVPVMNRFGFVNHERYLPDRRDLNRAFPGKPEGSATARYAARVWTEIISKCTHVVDLHTAGLGRTNLPQIRADLENEGVRGLARAFGTNIIIGGRGPRGSLRRVATDAGIPSVLFEAGETFKFQRVAVQAGIQGVHNVMAHLGMTDVPVQPPEWQVMVKSSVWVRANHGGLLDVLVKPGNLVYEGDVVGVITNPFGRELDQMRSEATGLVIGTTTNPLVNPGNPICHIAKLDKTLSLVEKFVKKPETA